MSYIPDCRTDEYYNEKYLNDIDKSFIAGFDYAVEQIVNLFEHNVDVYPELQVLLAEHVAMTKAGKDLICSEAVKHWSEMQRDEVITSMLDGYVEEDYNAIKARVDAEETA